MKYKPFHNSLCTRYFVINGLLLTELHIPNNPFRLFKLRPLKRSTFQLTSASRGTPPLRLTFSFPLSQTKQFWSHPNKNTHILQ